MLTIKVSLKRIWSGAKFGNKINFRYLQKP